MKARPLTRAMLRELKSIATYGRPGELDDYGSTVLAFYAREKTIEALLKRGLISDAETATDAGRAALAAHDKARDDHSSVEVLARAGVSWIKRGDY